MSGRLHRPRRRRGGAQEPRVVRGASRRRRLRVVALAPFDLREEPPVPPLERLSVVIRERLHDAHVERVDGSQVEVQEEAEILLHVLRQRLRRGDDEIRPALLDREDAVPLRDVARQQPQHRRLEQHDLPRRQREHPDALRREPRDVVLARGADLQHVGREVVAVEHLARDRVLDGLHRGDVALDEERREGRHQTLPVGVAAIERSQRSTILRPCASFSALVHSFRWWACAFSPGP